MTVQHSSKEHASILTTKFVLVTTIFIEGGCQKAIYEKVKGQMNQNLDIFFFWVWCAELLLCCYSEMNKVKEVQPGDKQSISISQPIYKCRVANAASKGKPARLTSTMYMYLEKINRAIIKATVSLTRNSNDLTQD